MRGTALVIATVAAACGLGPFAGEGGGDSNLPTAGIGPYGKLEADLTTPIDEPILLADIDADLLEPALLARPGGGYRIFVERDAGDGNNQVWTTEVSAFGEGTERPLSLALIATQSWEGDSVRAPSVARSEGGDLLLAYEAGDPASIGVARSTDDGASFASPTVPALENARAPSIAVADGVIYLFAERVDQAGIFVAVSNDGQSFELLSSPVLEAGVGVEDFDRAAVERPSALVRTTTTGRQRFDLFFQGRTGVVTDGDPEIAIGYAGGFELDDLGRAAPVGVPILAQGSPSEESPTVIIEPTRGVMLYVDRSSVRARIGVATSP